MLLSALHEKSMIHLVISYFKTALIFWGFPFEKKKKKSLFVTVHVVGI